MRKKLFYFSGLALLSAIYAAQPPALTSSPAPITFPVYGFSINPFETQTDGLVLQALQMSWPIVPLPSDKNKGFAPAINVMVWPATEDMAQYEAKQRLDLQAHNMTIQHESINKDNTEWTLEYVGVGNGGAAMHWYAHIVNGGKRIYIATGTTPDEMWSLYGDKVKACVDSLKSTGTAQIGPLTAPATTVPPLKLTP